MSQDLSELAQLRSWDLGGGRSFAFTLPPKLTRQNMAKLRRYFDALEAEVSICWDEEAAGGA